MAKKAEKSPKRGRPPLDPADRRRQMVSVRFRDETRRQLELAAHNAGRPLSQEIEHRVEQSFERRDLLHEVMSLSFGHNTTTILTLVGRAIEHTLGLFGSLTDNKARPLLPHPDTDRLLLDANAFAEVQKAVATVLDEIKPKGVVDAEHPARVEAATYGWTSVGEVAAQAILHELRDKTARPTSRPGRLRPLLKDFGADLD